MLPRRQAKWVLMCLLMGLAAAWAQRQPAATKDSNPLGSSKQVIDEGAELYSHTCTACHGMNGGAGERAPALAGDRAFVRRTDSEIFDAIQNGIAGTGMPPSGLVTSDIWKVVAYIRSLRASASDAFVPGDASKGEQIFWGQVKCGSCHMIDGRGGILGPDLSNIGGTRTLDEIRRALTKARTPIPSGYQPAEVVTKQGQRYTGIIKNEDNFSLQLLDSHDQLQLFNREELRDVHYEPNSLMPALYDKTLSPAELQDLLAFLSRLARDKPESHGSGEDRQ